MSLKEITIEITQQCPNCCLYCSSMSDPSKRAFLSYELIKPLIDDAIELGVRSINLSGGEPFMHPDILKIIDYIYSKRISCLVYSSGIVMTGHNNQSGISKEALDSVKNKISKLIINIEGADEETYNQIMGTSFGGFHMMQTTIRNAVSIGLIVEAHVVPMKINLQQIPKIIAMCSGLGISRVSFLRLVVQGRALRNQEQLELSNDEITYAKELIATSALENMSNIRLGIPFSDCAKRINCMTGISKLDIRYDGRVYPCEAFKNDNLRHLIMVDADSIRNNSLKDIYQVSEYLIKTRELLNDFQEKNTCETCMNQYYAQYGKH